MKPPKRPKQNGQNKTAETTENINYRKNGRCKILKYEFYGNFFEIVRQLGGGGGEGGSDNPEEFDYTEY